MAVNQVDAALALPAPETGAALLALHEDQWFDRKSVRVLPKDLGPPLTAFANAEGGIIVIGLHDGQVEGCRRHREKINSFRQAAIDFTVPPIRMAVSEVGCVNNSGEDDLLLVIRVAPGERVHEVKTGDCYLRIGDETRKLSYPQRQELEYDKGQAQYDGLPCPGVTMKDLDERFLEDYRQSIRATSINGLMQTRNLLTRSGEITNAAYLLFGEHPQDVFPQAQVRVMRFLSTERGTGARFALEEGTDRRAEGPIPRCVTDAAAIIDELLPRRRHLASSGRFEATPIVPRDAWLGGLVNAIIHRSYSMAVDYVCVEIFPDRIEIESPGRFPGLPDPARPSQITRFARNPRIARVCADLHIAREAGEGIGRIFDEMRFAGLVEPVYKQTRASVRLILSAEKLMARYPDSS
ncbi:MAG TPA: ATP-binding protein [Trebonia sp.]|nr:ATP-binding protein [Trebonia sp.]